MVKVISVILESFNTVEWAFLPDKAVDKFEFRIFQIKIGEYLGKKHESVH